MDVFKNNNEPMMITKTEFAKLLQVDENDQSLQQLFQLYSEDVRRFYLFSYDVRCLSIPRPQLANYYDTTIRW